MRFWSRSVLRPLPRVRQVVREFSPLAAVFADQTPFQPTREELSNPEQNILERLEQIISTPEVVPVDETPGGVGSLWSVSRLLGDTVVTVDELERTRTDEHGNLSGLADDDHTQYHNHTRGDARYYTKTELMISGILDSRYLYKGNTTPFTPDQDYEPATKKYVDDNAGGASAMDDLSDADTTTDPPENNEVLKWNGTNWVPAPYDYDFAFSIASFSDGISDTSQLIGSGTWKAVGTITFTATYNNPPGGMTAEVAMSGANNAWSGNLSMTPVEGPETNTEIVEYPTTTGGTVTFTLSQSEDGTTMVDSVTFNNTMRHGNSTLTSGNQTEVSLEALTEVGGPNESRSQTVSNIPTTANYLVFAYADRLSDVAQVRRNHDGLGYVTASFNPTRTSVAPSIQSGVASVDNSGGYSEAFACITSTDTGLADGSDDFQLMTSGTAQNYIRAGGITKASGYTEADIETGLTDAWSEATNDQTQIWSTVTLAASEYYIFAMPSRLSTPAFYDNDTGFEAAFEDPETVSITNDAGFQENYKVFRSENILGPGDFTLRTE